VLNAIQPRIPLPRVLEQWDDISKQLRESNRARSSQMEAYFNAQLLS